ncbi:MAG: acetamidase/formamidase family protein [Nitriliruptoraceae bacterium]
MSDVLEFVPTPDQFAYTFGGVGPVATIRPGTALRLWSQDAFNGTLSSPDHRFSERVDLHFVNPQTGPFHVEGAEPGDALAIHLVDLQPAGDIGVSTTVPLFGGLTATDRTAMLHPPLEERTWIYTVDRARGTIGFVPEGGGPSVQLPLDPMLGTIGVAPAGGEARSALVPDRHGGNLDSPRLRAGATLYLGVNVPGARFSLGDGHFRQGAGEACGTGVEGAMHSTVIVELIKGGAPPWPRVETDEQLCSLGSARPLEDAWRIAQLDLTRWVQQLVGWDELDAYQLLSQAVEASPANVVDANYTAEVAVDKQLLPAARVFDGIHERLRARATELT